MPTLTNTQVYAYARQAGFTRDQATIATAIANAESGRLTTNIGDTGIQTSTWGPSLGLWQIRSLKPSALAHAAGPDRFRDPAQLRDPAFNAQAAYAISNKGRTWSPWSVYTSGSYQRYLPDARAAAATVEGGGSGGTGVAQQQQQLAGRVATLAASGQNFAHLCLVFVREALGVGRKYGSADEAYNAGTRIGGNTHTDKNPPAGVPVYWRTGSAGHVALSAGGGKVWSTDIHGPGKISLVPIDEITQKWGATYLGWQETVNDVKVYNGPTAASVKTVSYLPTSNTGGAIGGGLGSVAGPLGGAAGAVIGDKLTGGGGIADKAFEQLPGSGVVDAVTSAVTDAIGGIAKGVVGLLVDAVKPLGRKIADFGLIGAGAVLGLTLVGAGVYRATKPQREAAAGAAAMAAI